MLQQSCLSRAICWLALAGLSVSVAGCFGVPFTTLWYFYNFSKTDFIKLKPEALRVAVKLDKGVTLKLGRAPIIVVASGKGAPTHRYKIPLSTALDAAVLIPELPRLTGGRHWQVLWLTSAGVNGFRSVQRLLGRQNAYHKFVFHWNGIRKLLNPIAKDGKVPLDLWLKLGWNSAVIEAYDGAIPVAKLRKLSQH